MASLRCFSTPTKPVTLPGCYGQGRIRHAWGGVIAFQVHLAYHATQAIVDIPAALADLVVLAIPVCWRSCLRCSLVQSVVVIEKEKAT